MANTIAWATGYDSTRVKETHRLGSVRAIANANTWCTFATACVNADGSGYIRVVRDGTVLKEFSFGAEPS